MNTTFDLTSYGRSVIEQVEKINDKRIDEESSVYINELKMKLINEMKDQCRNHILYGFDFDDEHYTMDEDSQRTIIMLYYLTQVQPRDIYYYHADNRPVRQFLRHEIQSLVVSLNNLRTFHTTYLSLIKEQIEECNDVDKLNTYYYGMELDQLKEDRFKDITYGLNFKFFNQKGVYLNGSENI